MSINISFHTYERYEGPLRVSSDVQVLDGKQKSAFVRLGKGNGDLTMYFDNIEDLEKVAFEFSTLVMEARDKWNLDGQKEVAE